MSNKFGRRAAIIAAACMLAGAVHAVEQRIVFVDMEKVFSEYYKTKLADAQLKTQADSFKAERKKLVDDFQAKQEVFNKARDEAQNTALNEEARNKKRTEAEELLVDIRDTESKIRRYDETKQKALDEQSQRMRKDIVVEIRDSLTTYSRQQGYSAVFDASGDSMNLVPLVLYRDPTADITEAVVGLLNKGKASIAPSDSGTKPTLRPGK